MLQEKTNLIEVVGLLSEVDIKPGNKNGKDYLAGKVVIKTTDTIDGIKNDIDIPFQVYANKLTNSGNPNPAYESLEKVMNNMVSIAASGDPNRATVVRVYTEKGGLRENIWYDKVSGNVVCTVKPNCSFFNAVSRDKYEDTARFETVICIMSMEEEIDKDGIATGRLKIKGAVPGWNGSINIIDYVVGNVKAVEHIQTYWEKGDTVIVSGVINFTTKVEDIIEEMGFGEPLVKHRTRSHKEFVITRGSQQGLDEEEAFNTKEILEAVQERKLTMDKMKEEGANGGAKKAAIPDMSTLGF